MAVAVVAAVLLAARPLPAPRPATATPGADAVGQGARERVEAWRLWLELDVPLRDRNGRLLAYVYVGDLMVNAELVRQGYAQVTTVPPSGKYAHLFQQLQREAQEAGRGVWGVK